MKRCAENRNYRKGSKLRFAKPEKRVPVASERVGVASQPVPVASEEVAVASRQVPIGTNVARKPGFCGPEASFSRVADVSPACMAGVSPLRKGIHDSRLGKNKDAGKTSASHAPVRARPRQEDELDLRAMVFHVRPHEELEVRRALKRFGGPRRRRGAALAAALRALKIQMRKQK